MHLERAQLLLQQSRSADAEQEALLAVAQAPEQPLAYAYLALSRSNQGKSDALEAARKAVGLSPDVAFFHYVCAVVLHRGDREIEARAETLEAIRLDPNEETHFALLASIELAQRNWPAALAAAEQGLARNPEHVASANLRSMALVRLGRKDEAMETVDYALSREPTNALSHANQGWNCLHRNDPKQAQVHFREALRLNPEIEYARHGMLEALKARNPVYRGMLAYFLWMGRLSGRMQAVFIVGAYLGMHGMGAAAESNPTLAKVFWPLLTVFYLFVYLSWTAGPMFNLLLRFDRFGRLVLSRDERVATNYFGACVLVILLGLAAWARGWDGGAFAAIVGAALSICVAITFNRKGRQRKVFAFGALALAAIGGVAVTLLTLGQVSGTVVAGLFVLGFFAMQIAANFIRR